MAEQDNILQGGQAVLQALTVQQVGVALPLSARQLQLNLIQPPLHGSVLLTTSLILHLHMHAKR